MYFSLVFQYSNCIFAMSVDTLHTATFPPAVLHSGMEVDNSYSMTNLILTFFGDADCTVQKKSIHPRSEKPLLRPTKKEDRRFLAQGTLQGRGGEVGGGEWEVGEGFKTGSCPTTG